MIPVPSLSLRGQVVILTGAAGHYGRGLAAQLAATGATLVIASRQLEALEAVAVEERARGHKVTAETLDQADEASVLALRDRVLARHGRIHGLVNNAVARPMGGDDAPVEQWDESMRVNARGVFLMVRAFGATMAEAGGGSIVNIGSIQGMVGPDYSLYEGLNMGTVPDYFFHKAGMINLTRYYAARLGPHGVRVNCLSPGGFFNHQPPEFVRRDEQQTFLRRMAGVHDLGGPVAFLLSEASAYITGVNLAVDGGYTAH
jgi:NAD(P)-dependent dehydrogenase (short-subunit alcohol dehydrogenase family)